MRNFDFKRYTPWPKKLLRASLTRHLGVCKARARLINQEETKKGALYSWVRIFHILHYVPVKLKVQHPPRQPLGHLNFWNLCWSNSPPPGQKGVQMHHYRSILGDQMPPPPGDL